MAGVVNLPEKVLKKLYMNILPQWKVCFFSALIVGLIAHLYKITNWLPNWDSLVFRYDSQNMVALGRWFLPVACSLSSFYDLPFFNGMIAIVFHALGAVCICRILDVQEKITAFMIGATCVSFSTVTSVMMYNYVADGYSIAFFLSTLAAFFMTKKKPRYILASIMIALTAGIYQAYITVTIMLILFKLIDKIIHYNTSLQSVLRKSVCMLLSGILGMVLYSIVLKVVLSVLSVELLDYQGISSAASLSGIDLFESLYVIKETFINCFFDLSGGVNVYVALNGLVVIFSLVHYVKNIIEHRVYKKPINIFVIILMGIMLIVGAGALAFINAYIDYHNLMTMGYFVFYLFFLILYERGTNANEKHKYIKQWSILLVAMAIITNQVVISNVSYHKAQIAYEKSYGVLIRIADRIEQTPDSEKCNRILVVGALDNSEGYSVNLTPNITGITDGYIIRADDETVGQSVLCSALSDYCEKNYEFVYGEEKKMLAQSEIVKGMNKWPARDCVTVIDDIVIIKLGTEGEK